jgi:glycosyltransferase involved in cell wall biosynthesis
MHQHRYDTVADLRITVIMPAYNAEPYLRISLPPLIKLLDSGQIDELIVVDDHSVDETASVARSLGAKVISSEVNAGPAAARNLGATEATGDILWFVDADVAAHFNGPSQIRRILTDPDVGAMFGSYDSDPADPHWFSRYKNLMHRYYHQNSGPTASTFWSGCGAVRTKLFEQMGGFNADEYPYAGEDIELGYRISSAGHRIVVDRDFEGKHLKRWRMFDSLRTDITCRALPWSRLMISREGLTNELNVSVFERIRAAFALAALSLVIALPINISMWPITSVVFVASLALNWRFGRFLYRHGGVQLAAPSIVYHQFYYVYASLAFVWVILETLIGRCRRSVGQRLIAPFRSSAGTAAWPAPCPAIPRRGPARAKRAEVHRGAHQSPASGVET